MTNFKFPKKEFILSLNDNNRRYIISDLKKKENSFFFKENNLSAYTRSLMSSILCRPGTVRLDSYDPVKHL
jgi:hypothetical protein